MSDAEQTEGMPAFGPGGPPETPHASVGLAELFDVDVLQSMMGDFYSLTQIPMSVIDIEGNVIVGAGWQRVCVEFHRVNPDTCTHCIESDTALTTDIPRGESRLYRCKNGMWDAAMPVFVGETHVANVFTGQFFFDDEQIDLEFFGEQARRHGFPEEEYLAAVQSVPRLSREDVETGLHFLTKLSKMLSQLSFGNLELVRLGAEREALLESERMRSMSLRTLAEVDELLASSLDLSEVIARALESAERHLGVAASSVWTLEAGGRLRVVGARGFPEAFLADYREGISINDPYPVAQAAHARLPILYDRVVSEELYAPVREAYARYGISLGSLAAVPLIARGHIIGALTLAWNEEREFDPAELSFISSLSSRFSNAIENARLFEERSRQATYAEALNRINSVVHEVLDVDEIMRRVVAEMSEALDVDGSLLQLWREGVWESAYSFGIGDETKGHRLRVDKAPLSAYIASARRPLVVPDVIADERTEGSALRRLGFGPLLGLPLTVRDDVIGVLFTARARGRHEFPPHEVDFAAKVASTVSLALENARLYESQHVIAETLQEALLAIPDHVAGLDLAHEYRSATATTRVGGDFYDVFELGQEQIGVTIGDVAGKGLDAAVLTSLVKNAVRAHASEQGKTPGRVLELTNDIVYHSTPAESFVTIFFGIFDPTDGSLVYANAGHTSGMHVLPGTSVSRLAPTGPLLGAFEHVGYLDARTKLSPDEVLFLYTDGLTEARRDSELFGEDRLMELLPKTDTTTARQVIADVLQAVLEFADGRLSDDLAVLAVRRVAESE